jgi:hypothetical protein
VVRLDADPDQYRTASSAEETTVDVQRVPGGLRCAVVANADPTQTHSGGAVIPLHGAKACRIEMAFKEPEAIILASADAWDARHKTVARWKTVQWARLSKNRATYVFVQQEAAREFQPVAMDAGGLMEAIRIRIDVQRETGAVFEVYKVETIK